MLHKEGFFWCSSFTFPSIFSDWWVVWSWFWYRCKELLLSNLLDTYNMVVGCVEIFLTTLRKNFSWKHGNIQSEAICRVDKFCRPLNFFRKTFFKGSLEKFLRIQQPCCMYLEGCSSVALYNGSKIMIIRLTNQKIWKET